LGYHLEQAARYRRELGRGDPGLERRAALRLGDAGSKAALRSDAHGASNLLMRAIALLATDDPARAPLLIELIGTLEGAARPEEMFAWIDQLAQSDDPIAQMHSTIAQLQLMTDPEDIVEEATSVSAQALEVFGETGDDLGLAHTYYLISWINWLQSRAGPTVAAYQKVIEHGRQSHGAADRRAVLRPPLRRRDSRTGRRARGRRLGPRADRDPRGKGRSPAA